jgi:hypothetical protein
MFWKIFVQFLEEKRVLSLPQTIKTDYPWYVHVAFSLGEKNGCGVAGN